MIRKILKRFFTDSFSVEWRKHNSHNFTTPANHFKADMLSSLEKVLTDH